MSRPQNMSSPSGRGMGTANVRRLRLAELTLSLGAGVLGLGIGVLLAHRMRGLAVPSLLLGGLLHAWGMTDKRHLEGKAGAVNLWWSTLLYWVCWGLLAALAAYVVLRRS